ncbi:hypothetical protein F5X96DRAFT_147059 [Biscogniauxia mediterranea]|nr:hypothetical protein F5X96DRAFT_147059 [Biscogniauxia mediterranea]
MATYYEQRMLNLPERYGISNNARNMLKAYDDFKTARIDEAALGRLIRLSPNNRAALASTMVKCANIMKDKPEESKHCFAIISSCGEMVQIADKPPPMNGFPSFTKLPREIRERIYDFYLGNSRPAVGIIPHPKHGDCRCAAHQPPQYASFTQMNISLAFTCKYLRDEVLSCFYSKRMFYFPCACEMGYLLSKNAILMGKIRSIKFHWCGEDADNGISALKDVKNLDHLVVVISKNTTKHLTIREEEIRRYFTPRRTPTMLPEALGFDELMELRGIGTVEVEHINIRKAGRRTDDDVSSLATLLRLKARRARQDDGNDENGASGNFA